MFFCLECTKYIAIHVGTSRFRILERLAITRRACSCVEICDNLANHGDLGTRVFDEDHVGTCSFRVLGCAKRCKRRGKVSFWSLEKHDSIDNDVGIRGEVSFRVLGTSQRFSFHGRCEKGITCGDANTRRLSLGGGFGMRAHEIVVSYLEFLLGKVRYYVVNYLGWVEP